MKNLVIFGAPGSGKGTQSDILVEKYGFDHISTGDVLRAEIKADTELGRTAKSYIDNGQLIPDSLMIDILAATYDALPKKAGVIFDGFPRTSPQAEALKEMLAQRGTQVHAMLELSTYPTKCSWSVSSTAVKPAVAPTTTKKPSASVSPSITTKLPPSSSGTKKRVFAMPLRDTAHSKKSTRHSAP